ncbi:MAG: methyltransferase [Cyanobacteria bacterium P01_H01_bin.74]
MTPDSNRIQNALYAFTTSQLVFSAVELSIFSHIDAGYTNIVQLAKITGLDARALKIFLNGLVGIGFLSSPQGNTYSLPEDVAQFLVKSSPDYLGGMVKHCKRLSENWAMLSESLRSGQPVGGSQSLQQLEVYFSELVQGLYVSNFSTAKKLAELLYPVVDPESPPLSILDAAAGSAVWSIALLERYPKATATVIDFQSVIDVTKQFVEKHQLVDRFQYCAGDIEVMALPDTQHDVVILANICHALGPYASKKIFKKLAKVIKPSGQLVIVDFVADSSLPEKSWPLVFGVNMLVSTPEGDIFSETDYRTWLSEAGFSSVGFKEIDVDVTAIIACF